MHDYELFICCRIVSSEIAILASVGIDVGNGCIFIRAVRVFPLQHYGKGQEIYGLTPGDACILSPFLWSTHSFIRQRYPWAWTTICSQQRSFLSPSTYHEFPLRRYDFGNTQMVKVFISPKGSREGFRHRTNYDRQQTRRKGHQSGVVRVCDKSIRKPTCREWWDNKALES